MAIITKPAVEKGTAVNFTLNKVDLALVPSVAADTYYSDTTNWKLVRLYYQSSTGNQREVVLFDATQATPQGEFLVSLKARDIFEVRRIVIEDFDGGMFQVNRADLPDPETNFDISFVPTGPVALFTRNYGSPSNFQAWEETLGGEISIVSNNLRLALDTSYTSLSGVYTINDLPAAGFNMQQNTNYTLEVDYTSVSTTAGFFLVQYKLGTDGTAYNTFIANYSPSGGTLSIPLNPLNTNLLSDSNLKIEFVLSASNLELVINISEIRIYQA